MRVGFASSLKPRASGHWATSPIPLLGTSLMCVGRDHGRSKVSRLWRIVLPVLFLASAFPSFAARPFTMTVEREATCNKGEVTGRLLVDGTEVAKTFELPWRNNEEDISQIPPGTYPAFIRSDGDLGWRIELMNVPDRVNVQLHVGNYTSQTKGCILLGTSITRSGSTCATQGSRAALEAVRKAMQKASDNGISSQRLAITVVVR